MKYATLENYLKATEEGKLLKIDISQSHHTLIFGVEYNDIWAKDMTKRVISGVEIRPSASKKSIKDSVGKLFKFLVSNQGFRMMQCKLVVFDT